MFDAGKVFWDGVDALQLALAALAISVLIFGVIALAVKGREAMDAAFRAIVEVRLNLAFYFFDALFVAPILTVLITALRLGVGHRVFISCLERADLDCRRPSVDVRDRAVSW